MLLESDLDIAARTIYGEARGEAWDGKVAIARVLINRWRSDKGQWAKDDTLASACLRHVQLSTWTKDDPNFPEVVRVSLSNLMFRDCWRAVLHAIDMGIDPTHGSLYYTTISGHPPWSEGATPIVEIGGYRFYNNLDSK